jgi:uncharacterized protein YnzC (UPF0291/DUF896 family)
MVQRYLKVSEENQLTLIPNADFTMKDLELIEKFKENGMLGLHTLVDTDVERMMGLYLDGKSYRQIASLLKKNKAIVLFIAHKFKWFELRREYLDELQATLKDKVLESKLQSQDFLLHLVLAYQKKIGKNIDQFLRTDNEEFADKVDNKDLGTLFKTMELLHKLSNENLSNPNDKSMVSLNGLSDGGVTITKTGANSVEITPKSPFSSKLKQFADLKRQAEKDSQPQQKQTHDITVEEQTLTEKENENED